MDEYLDVRIKNLDELKIKVDLSMYTTSKLSRGGINGEITELRQLILTMLNSPREIKPGDKKWKPISMIAICSLTKGWTAQELYSIYRESIEFSKNPAALFWIKYKEFKKKYGEKIKKRINERRFCEMGKKRRKNKQDERQGLLF